MRALGGKLFDTLLAGCVCEPEQVLPGESRGVVVGVDLGIGPNGVYVLGHLCDGGYLRVFKSGELGVCGLVSCFDTVCVHLELVPVAWVMGWDGEVKQSLHAESPADWLRFRNQTVTIVRESVAASLSRLGRCLGRGPSDLRVQIDRSCTGLLAALRLYRTSIADAQVHDDACDWPSHFTDALRYVVTPDWRPRIGRHASVIARDN